MWTFLTGLLPSLIGLAGKGVDTLQKNKSQISTEQMSLRNQVSVQSAKVSTTWWDSFVDGINRLVRPCFTFGTLAIFVWAAVDPITFSQTMVALALVPQYLWYILGTIVVFWFGQRAIQGIKSPSLSTTQVKQAIEQINAIKQLSTTNTQSTPRIQEKIKIEQPKQIQEPKPTTGKAKLDAISQWEQWKKRNG